MPVVPVHPHSLRYQATFFLVRNNLFSHVWIINWSYNTDENPQNFPICQSNLYFDAAAEHSTASNLLRSLITASIKVKNKHYPTQSRASTPSRANRTHQQRLNLFTVPDSFNNVGLNDRWLARVFHMHDCKNALSWIFAAVPAGWSSGSSTDMCFWWEHCTVHINSAGLWKRLDLFLDGFVSLTRPSCREHSRPRLRSLLSVEWSRFYEEKGQIIRVNWKGGRSPSGQSWRK